MKNEQILRFNEKFKAVLQNKSLNKLTLSNQRDKSSDLKSIIITFVQLKKGLSLKFIYRYKTRDITKNFGQEESSQIIIEALEKDFYMADLYTADQNLKLLINPSGKAKLKSQTIENISVVSHEHDRKKERIITTRNNEYLRELGITNNNGELRREMTDKYLQINRYIEILEPEIKSLSIADEFHVVDMGAGKGYLTFSLYDYLTNKVGVKPQMTGVEFRDDLVSHCNDIAHKAGFETLRFVKGNIENTQLPRIDMLIALHACDTATDDAIYRGIRANASLIVCAPCCHKQIRREYNPTDKLGGILKHGILSERQAEIVTDGLRALIMEAWGYKTKVLEFISTEHTAKNLMIVGRKIPLNLTRKAELFQEIHQLKQLFGIKRHHLETLLEK